MAMKFEEERAWCKKYGRHFCEPDNPWSGKGPAMHAETEEVGEQSDGYPCGDTIRIRCKTCNHSWSQELPQ